MRVVWREAFPLSGYATLLRVLSCVVAKHNVVLISGVIENLYFLIGECEIIEHFLWRLGGVSFLLCHECILHANEVTSVSGRAHSIINEDTITSSWDCWRLNPSIFQRVYAAIAGADLCAWHTGVFLPLAYSSSWWEFRWLHLILVAEKGSD